VRQLAARTIAKLPLKHLSARVQDACGGGFRLVPGGRVRATLGGDAFLDDLVQEVGLAFWRAVSAGKIFAARPAVHAWLETTAPRVARRAVRPAAILAFMAPANDNDGRDPVQLPEFALRFEASNDNALDNLKEALRDPELLLALTPSERSVLIPSLAGETPTQIAASLGLQVTRYARDMGIRVALYANQMLALTRHSTKTQEENDIKMRMALTCGSLGRGRLAMPWVEAMLNHVWRQEPDPVWRTAIKAATRSWLEHLQDITAKLGPRPSDADFLAKIGIVPSAEMLDHGAYLLQANKQELARDPRFARVHEELASQEGYFGALELKMQALDAVGRRDPLQAIDLLRRAILKDPLNAEIHFRLGCSLWEIGDIASGLAELEIATQLAPDWDRCRVEIAIVLFNQGQVEEAQRRLLEGRAVLSKPSAWLLLHLAHSYERTGPQAKAMETYEEMLQLQPENAEALDRLAHLYFVTGERRKGADLAKRAAMLGVSTVLDAWQGGYYDKGAVARRPAHRGDDAFLQFPDSCWPEGVDRGPGHDGDVTATRREKARSPR
jgi:tetratricopeptide (TPR) repeat protein